MDTAERSVFELKTPRSRIVLHRGDCLAGMREHLAPGSVDVVVTSPPYNLGIRYKTYDDTAPRDDYLRWLGEWADAVKAVLADNGSLFLNVGSMPSPLMCLEFCDF